jgi:preprotein translocase subunit SecA
LPEASGSGFTAFFPSEQTMTSIFAKGPLGRIAKAFGTKRERDIRRLKPIVDAISEHYETLRSLSDDELRAKTESFRRRLADGETTDALLPEAFAVVKDACRRNVGRKWMVTGFETEWDMIPFDVQLMGAISLHEGNISEMATGEGKTLVAILPLYLNGLTGRGAHLVTVNDYLARRDSEWVGEILRFLGLTVGCIQNQMAPPERKAQYACDVTYGTNNEFGFDYLRDNMAVRAEDRVQRGHHYAIVDEVDSVLIDEARTPLIISGPVAHSLHQYAEMRGHAEKLVRLQNRKIVEMIDEIQELLGKSDTDAEALYRAGERLLQVSRGAPKNKRFMKLLADDPSLPKLIQRVEADRLRDKTLHLLDDELYFAIDEKNHTVNISEIAHDATDPELFVVPDLSETLAAVDQAESLSPAERAEKKDAVHRDYGLRSERIHDVQTLLKAYALYEKDVEYVVQDDRILIVDQFTGRLMPGRRFSDGLHQALEAKEGVKIEGETQTFATITIQNYFRMYGKLAGMTGTAETEAEEFWSIYELDVVVIPTNQPVCRVDFDDVIYRTRREKYNAIIDEIARLHEIGLPVLVGTVSVEVSETLSRMLARRGIKHNVLNAKHHQREAEIVRHAGQRAAVTIATNMAGRGTDIKLGPGVVTEFPDGQPSGLQIIGSERHEARRIDRQLRGRSGRQGDPGSSRFFISLEDDLMRLFAQDRLAGWMERLGHKEGEALEHPLLTKSIERAQKRVEIRNFEIRKHLLEYDNVMNKQREIIYARRNRILDGESTSEEFLEMIAELIEESVERHVPPGTMLHEVDLRPLITAFEVTFLTPITIESASREEATAEALLEELQRKAVDAYRRREQELTEPVMRELERHVLLRTIDEKWRDHLYELDHLKEGVGWASVGGKDPLLEYKKGAYEHFLELNELIRDDALKLLFRVQVRIAGPPPGEPVSPARPPARAQRVAASLSGRETRAAGPTDRRLVAAKPGISAFGGAAGASRPSPAPAGGPGEAPRRTTRKVGRNEPCPCGSGKKYKKCCGAA